MKVKIVTAEEFANLENELGARVNYGDIEINGFSEDLVVRGILQEGPITTTERYVVLPQDRIQNALNKIDHKLAR